MKQAYITFGGRWPLTPTHSSAGKTLRWHTWRWLCLLVQWQEDEVRKE